VDYLFFMHDDVVLGSEAIGDDAWELYIAKLQQGGHFSGGSAIGGGITINKSGAGSKRITRQLTGIYESTPTMSSRRKPWSLATRYLRQAAPSKSAS
jgi:hypothetical protein